MTADGLEIPERALRVACDVYDAALTCDTDGDDQSGGECAERQAVRAAAPIIVAAELIERADAIDARALKAKPGASVPLAQEAFRLRRRAAELDPERNTTSQLKPTEGDRCDLTRGYHTNPHKGCILR